MHYQFKEEYKDITGMWISDALENEMERWNQKDVVFINSPTGSGKNTFIKDKLLPFAKQKSKKVLILSNRSALDLQQKEEAFYSMYDEDFSKTQIEISPLQLEKQFLFGNAIICSYQQFLFLLCAMAQQGLMQQIGYIVLDEAHFFVADSRFNPNTEIILDTILNHFFACTTRIYMSATSSKIVSIIKDKENKGFNQYQNGKPTPPFPRAPIFFFYHQDINYSYCSFHFFEKWNLLANVIKKSPEDEKWLIFIREKGMRAEIEKNLKPFVSGNHISYIDAESKDSPMFRYIVKHKRFEGRVLIATSALDNGIGLCDPKLKHIVISTFDEESAIQMLGRKRRESNEPLDVYFRIPTATEVEAAYTYTKQLLEVVDTYNNDPSQFLNRYWGKLTPPIQKLFSIVPDGTLDINSPIGFFNNRNFYRLVLNKLAQDKLSYDKDLLGELSCCLKSTVEHSFEKVILSWFFEDEDIFSPSMLLKIDENEMKERIRSYIENLLEQELDKSQVEIHFKAIFELYGEMEGKNEKSFSASFKANLNACLEDLSLPFAFEKLKSSVKKDRWHFVKNN